MSALAARLVAAIAAAVLLVAGLGAVLAGCGGEQAEPPSFEPGMPSGAPLIAALTTNAGTWDVTLWTAPQPPRKGTVAVKYRLLAADGAPADGVTLAVVPWMPAHGHGSSRAPTVTAEGDGWYQARGVSLYMSGQWELRTAMSQGAASDNVVPVVDVP